MKMILVRTLAAIAGLVLFFLAAPVATALPNDVSASPAVSGNTVTVTMNNNFNEQIGCEAGGWPPGSDPISTTPSFGGTTLVAAGGSTPVVFENVPNGTYDIHWACTVQDNDPNEWWATFSSPGIPKTAEPVTVTVPNNQMCFGSVCI